MCGGGGGGGGGTEVKMDLEMVRKQGKRKYDHDEALFPIAAQQCLCHEEGELIFCSCS